MSCATKLPDNVGNKEVESCHVRLILYNSETGPKVTEQLRYEYKITLFLLITY